MTSPKITSPPHGIGHVIGRQDQLESLRHLDLSGQEGIGASVATNFLCWQRLPSLHSLHLMACALDAIGLPPGGGSNALGGAHAEPVV